MNYEIKYTALKAFNLAIAVKAYSKAADILRPINDNELERATFPESTKLYRLNNAPRIEVLFGPDHTPIILTESFVLAASDLREHLDRSLDIEHEPLDMSEALNFFKTLAEDEKQPDILRHQARTAADALDESCKEPTYL